MKVIFLFIVMTYTLYSSDLVEFFPETSGIEVLDKVTFKVTIYQPNTVKNIVLCKTNLRTNIGTTDFPKWQYHNWQSLDTIHITDNTKMEYLLTDSVSFTGKYIYYYRLFLTRMNGSIDSSYFVKDYTIYKLNYIQGTIPVSFGDTLTLSVTPFISTAKYTWCDPNSVPLQDSNKYDGLNSNILNIKQQSKYGITYKCKIELPSEIRYITFNVDTPTSIIEETINDNYRYYDLFGREIIDIRDYTIYFRLNLRTNKIKGMLK